FSDFVHNTGVCAASPGVRAFIYRQDSCPSPPNVSRRGEGFLRTPMHSRGQRADREAAGPLSATAGNDSRNARALAALRIGVGVFFLVFGEYKVFGTQFTLRGGFEHWIHKFLDEGAAYPFMIPVLQDFVLRFATPIAFLVAYGELAIGLS